MNLKYVFLSLLILTTTAVANTISIKSTPDDAKVYIKDVTTQRRHLLGKTPYLSNIAELKSSFKVGGQFIVEIEKQGYLPYNVYLNPIKKSKIQLSSILQLKAEDKINKSHSYDNIISKLFDAQRMVRSKSYNQALKVLDSIEDEARYLSTYYEIKAGTLYLKKDFNGALANYRKAYSLNEENRDAFSMKKYLEKSFGGKR